MNKISQKLYMYFTAESAALCLKEHTIKFSDLARCNDPFECRGSSLDEKIPNYVQEIKSECRVACFSEDNRSILMWAYYADKHRGVCIEFDTSNDPIFFNENSLYRVEYSNSFPIITTINRENALKILLTKATCWEHENEVRLIMHEKQMCNNLLTINPQAITAVIFGCNSGHYYSDIDSTRKDAIRNIINYLQRPAYNHIKIMQAKSDKDKYELEIKEVPFMVFQIDNAINIVSFKDQSILLYDADSTLIYKAQSHKWETMIFHLSYGKYYLSNEELKSMIDSICFEIKEDA